MSSRGFTLFETLLTISLVGLLMGAIGTAIITFYRAQDYSFEQAIAINEARKGIKTMVQEIREARDGENGAYIIEQADDHEFVFFSDIDNDNRAERVRYFLDGSNFTKGVTQAAGLPLVYATSTEDQAIVSQYVRNGTTSIFAYYNGDWPGDQVANPLPTPTRLLDTKLMEVTLEINVDPARAPDTFSLRSNVQVRNLKTNL